MLLLAALSAAAQSAPAPELTRIIRELGGEWSITERYPQEAGQRIGRGTERWEFGPDRKWAIYRYAADTPRGHAAAIAVFWWDPNVQALKELWCFDSGKTSCEVSKAIVAWQGSDLVLEIPPGQPGAFRERWSDIRPGSHSMRIEEPDGRGGYHVVLESRAVKRRH